MEKRYEIKFVEMGVDKDHVDFLVQSVPTYSVTRIVTMIKSITGLPPYINTRKLTKPLLQVASKKKLKRGYWVHFSLENGCTVDCIWSRAIP
jgi:REP element-mobilizing transposase RayT